MQYLRPPKGLNKIFYSFCSQSQVFSNCNEGYLQRKSLNYEYYMFFNEGVPSQWLDLLSVDLWKP